MKLKKREMDLYQNLLHDIKKRVRQAQVKATLSVNAEMIAMYWEIGKLIHHRQQEHGWGAGIIPMLSKDLKNELPEIKGFSERNLGYMVRFVREYPEFSILQLPVAKFADKEIVEKSVDDLSIKAQRLVAQIGWAHHIILMQKIKDLPTRLWYMEQTLVNGWSRDTLCLMIRSNLHHRQGKAVTNFDATLANPHSDFAKQMLKDPYIFDFLTLAEPFNERELETELMKQLEKFLIELGAGFAFVGRQYHLVISEKDFYIDLLFYHLKLRCYIVIELKKGDFKPEYAGKLNFYCSAVDDVLKHPSDQPSIGLILCQNNDKIFAEYALRDIHKPIGISEYELTQALPNTLKGSLPSIEEIEAELSRDHDK